MSTQTLKFSIGSEKGTQQLAVALAQLAVPGDIILLEGDLGAGKSFLARALLRSAARDEALEVPSPTFSLVQPYKFGGVDYLHADLYRLSDESEAEELGLFEENAIRLIEWPDRLPELADASAFEINLSNVSGQEFARTCTINAQPDRLKQLAERLESSSDIALT